MPADSFVNNYEVILGHKLENIPGHIKLRTKKALKSRYIRVKLKWSIILQCRNKNHFTIFIIKWIKLFTIRFWEIFPKLRLIHAIPVIHRIQGQFKIFLVCSMVPQGGVVQFCGNLEDLWDVGFIISEDFRTKLTGVWEKKSGSAVIWFAGIWKQSAIIVAIEKQFTLPVWVSKFN